MYKQGNHSLKMTFVFPVPRNNDRSLTEEKGIKIFLCFSYLILWSSLTLQRWS